MANRQNTLLLKRSNIIGKIPPLSGLTLGEMALNTADAKLYTLFTSGTTGATEVRQIGWDRIHRTGDTVTGNLTVSGTTFLNGLSATTISATTIGTSGDCIDDIYVSNIHSCSPLNINPLNEGNVYFGSTSAVTIDLSNNRVGVGTSLPQETLHISGKTRFDNDITLWDDGVNNGESRKIIFRGLGQTGNTQDSSKIYLDAYGGTNGERLQFDSPGIRFRITDADGFYEVSNLVTNNPAIASFQTGGLGFQAYSLTSGFTFNQGYNQTSGDLFKIWNDGLGAIPYKAFSILASNGNVGIGNITPSEKLDVSGKTKTTNLQVTANATPGYVLTAIDSSGNARWEAVGSDSNDLDPVLSLVSTTASTVSVGDRFLISGATISIWSGRTNQVAEYTGSSPTDYSYYIPATDDVVFVTDTLTTYRFDGTNWIAWRGVAILQNGNALTTPVNIGSNNNQNLTFRTSGQTRVTISGSTGNVGIGTTTPQARLHVAGTNLMSAATQNVLTVIGSGNTNSSPIFSVQGSQGELFSVTDSLTGSLFSVNDISGLPVIEVFSDDTILMGSFDAPSLNTTTRVFATTGTTNVYSISTSAYTGAFFDYTVSDGTNLRAGNIMSVWSGSSVNYTETQTTDFGNTSGLTFNMVVSSGNAILRTSGTTGNWTVKTIVRSI